MNALVQKVLEEVGIKAKNVMICNGLLLLKRLVCPVDHRVYRADERTWTYG